MFCHTGYRKWGEYSPDSTERTSRHWGNRMHDAPTKEVMVVQMSTQNPSDGNTNRTTDNIQKITENKTWWPKENKPNTVQTKKIFLKIHGNGQNLTLKSCFRCVNPNIFKRVIFFNCYTHNPLQSTKYLKTDFCLKMTIPFKGIMF